MGVIGLLMILGWDIWSGQTLEVIFGELLIDHRGNCVGDIEYLLSSSLDEMPKIQSSAFQMTFGTIGIFIATLLMEWGEPIQFNVFSIYYILFAGVFASALCFTGWFIVLS